MTDSILMDRSGRLQTIRFNRIDKKNAITRDMYQAMGDAVVAADSDEGIGATLFLGQPNCFTAGNDLQDFIALATGQAEPSTEVVHFLRAIITGEKPLIAGVDGLAIGVGVTMLMHCDLVYASDRARLQTPFVDLGIIPEAASSLIGPKIMGHQKAFEMLAMGEWFSADRAYHAGLVNEVTTADELESRAIEAATKAAERAPTSMAISRRLLRGEREELLARLEEEFGHFAERLASDEAREAFLAIMNKGKAKA